MRKKIVFIAIIIGIVVGCDLLIGAVTKDAILNVRDVGVNQTNTVQAFFKRTADVLILGPSTANHHYDCKIIEDSLGMTCFNAGRDGQNIIYDAMVLDGFLTRCTPKLVVVDVTHSTLSDTWMSSLNDFNCYYGSLQPIDDIIDSIGSPIERIKRMSNIYRYNKTWEWLLNARFAKTAEDLDGYRPLEVKEIKGLKSTNESSQFVMAEECRHYLDRIIDICKEKNVKILFTISPTLIIDEGNFAKDVNDVLQKKGLWLMNWNGDTTYTNHPELFYDKTHLNAKGAAAFTKEFVGKVKDVLN